jgi:hypothetical protein
MNTGFLCGNCRENMCEDCVNIADEYAELLKMRTNALHTAEHENGKLKLELAAANRRAQMYEEVARAGVGEIISAWMDKEIKQLLKEKP